jgi:Tfp pilus assembly protein PilP
MRNLGILILLSVAAFAQTPTAVQNPAAPAMVSVKPATTHPAQTGKPSPSGAKVSVASVGPKAKVVSVPAAAVKPDTAAKNAKAATNAKTVAVQSATVKPAAAAPKTKVQVTAVNAVPGPKAAPAAKSVPIAAVPVKPAVTPVPKAASKAPVSGKSGSVGAKPAVEHVMTKPATVKAVTTKPVARVRATTVHTKNSAATVTGAKVSPSVQEGKPATGNKPASQEIRTAGRRDPFVSPVVAMGVTGSGCSAGKRCLTIDQIALKGVVKAESGMIAVVTNALDKAYFLRENDPVFNGYVVKITGDSIIFKETFRDRLGKTLTRDVTKSITRPVA